MQQTFMKQNLQRPLPNNFGELPSSLVAYVKHLQYLLNTWSNIFFLWQSRPNKDNSLELVSMVVSVVDYFSAFPNFGNPRDTAFWYPCCTILKTQHSYIF